MTVNGAEVLRCGQSRTRITRQAQEHAHGRRSLSNSNGCLASSPAEGFDHRDLGPRLVMDLIKRVCYYVDVARA